MKEEVQTRKSEILHTAQKEKPKKPPGTDLTDEEFLKMTKQEKTQRLGSAFKFKSELISEKYLLMHSTIQ